MNIHGVIYTVRKVAAEWLTPNPPVNRSPYSETTQVGISMTGIITPDQYNQSGAVIAHITKDSENKEIHYASYSEANKGLADYMSAGWEVKSFYPAEEKRLPQLFGSTKVYKAFKPTKCIMTELVIATFEGEGLPDLVIHETVHDAADLVLVSAFASAKNCLMGYPSEAAGISGPTFANNSLGNGLSWTKIVAGEDLTLAIAVESSVLSRAKGGCNHCGHGYAGRIKGYNLLPRSVVVKARVNFLGPSYNEGDK